MMKAIKEPKGPIVEIINAPRGGTKLNPDTLMKLIEFAELNKAKRLLIVFER
jgi:hypothetical protein